MKNGELKSMFVFLNLFKLSKLIIFPTWTAVFW